MVGDEAVADGTWRGADPPNVSIRVLPFSAGLHAGLMAHGSFTILDFPEGNEPTTVYVEELTGALFLDRQDEAERYAWTFTDIAGRSLSEPSSRDLFWRTAKEYES